MILQTDRKQRNCNYLTLINNYNRLFEKYGDSKPLSKTDLYSLSMDLVLPENEDRVDDLLNAIEPFDDFDDEDSNNNFELLLYNDNDQKTLAKPHKIMPVASKEEVAIIYSMLQAGDFDLMLNDNVKAKLSKNISIYFDNLGITPADLFKYIENKGVSLCADKLQNIKNVYEALTTAINNDKYVRINYSYNDNVKEYIIQPFEFVYSQLDLRMRVKAFVADGYWMTFYLSYINDITVIDEKPFAPFTIKDEKKKTLVFTFYNEYGLAERVAARFSDYKKEIHYNKKNNQLKYIVTYDDTWTENSRIINRLRSLGKFITVESDEKDAIKADAQKALDMYRKASV